MLRSLLHTYFENSLHRAVTAMLELNKGDLDDDDIEKLARAIEKVKKEDLV